MKLTAGAPTTALVAALDRAEWGALDGHDFRGVRGVLYALCRVVEPKSGQGKATTWQIAQRAGYSDRWTRRCLLLLEELGLIEWQRGGVVQGKAVPSWFRVSKKALLDLVKSARQVVDEKRREHVAKVRERIAKARLHNTRPRNRRSDHAEVNTTLLSSEEVPRAAEPPLETVAADEKTMTDAVAQIRARLRQQRADRLARAGASKTATTTEGAFNPAARVTSETHTNATATVKSAQ